MKNYKFPVIEWALEYVLSYIYQEKESYDSLFEENIRRSESYLRNYPDNGFRIVEKLHRGDNGRLLHQENFNENGTSYTNIRYGNNWISLVNQKLGIDIRYEFSEAGFLLFEKHTYNDDGPSVYNFQIDGEGKLEKINDFEVKRIKGTLHSIINTVTNEVLIQFTGICKNKISFIDFEGNQKEYMFNENKRLVAIKVNSTIQQQFKYLEDCSIVETNNAAIDKLELLLIQKKSENAFSKTESTAFYSGGDKANREFLKISHFAKFKIDKIKNKIPDQLLGDYLSEMVDESFDYKSNFSNWTGYGPSKGHIEFSIYQEENETKYKINIPTQSPAYGTGKYTIKHGSIYHIDNSLVFSGGLVDEKIEYRLFEEGIVINVFDKFLRFVRLTTQNKNN